MRRSDSETGRAPLARTPAGLAKRLGRVVLWLLVVVLLIRGVVGVLSPREPAARAQAAPRALVAWPDDQARAFAVDFARTYLSTTPRDPDGYAARLAGFVGPNLAGSIAPDVPRHAAPGLVSVATVARTVPLRPGRALVTVAATVTPGGTRYLTVPVARDASGALAVFDLPSLAAPPRRAVLEAVPVQPLDGSEEAAIEDVLARFFRSYPAASRGPTTATTFTWGGTGDRGGGHPGCDALAMAAGSRRCPPIRCAARFRAWLAAA